MIDREQRRSCAPDDHQEPPHRDGTRKTDDPGRCSGVPSSPPPTQNAARGRNHCSPKPSNHFCNKIDRKRTPRRDTTAKMRLMPFRPFQISSLNHTVPDGELGGHMETAYQPESWRDLYVMLGTSSAALMGLLFVATSLHLEEIVNNPIFQLRALRNSIYLIVTLVEAACVLTPQSIVALGVELIVLNSLGFLLPLSNFFNLYKRQSFTSRGGFSVYRSATFITGFLLGVGGGVLLVVQWNLGLYVITASYLTLLVSVSMNAWLIMLGVGQAKPKAS